MRNLTTITVMLLMLTSCAASREASRDYIYNTYTAYPNKATAVALNSYGQFTGGWGLGGGFTLSQAKSEALNRCKQHNPQSTCVLERENNINVFNQSLASFRTQQQQAYIASIRAKCKRYGFVTDNAIAVCVQKEIQRNEQIRLQTNQQIAQQNRINSQNRARAFSELGKTLLESGQQKTKICNFKSFQGTIISGDCSKNHIDLGGESYWKVK